MNPEYWEWEPLYFQFDFILISEFKFPLKQTCGRDKEISAHESTIFTFSFTLSTFLFLPCSSAGLVCRRHFPGQKDLSSLLFLNKARAPALSLCFGYLGPWPQPYKLSLSCPQSAEWHPPHRLQNEVPQFEFFGSGLVSFGNIGILRGSGKNINVFFVLLR